MNFNQAEEEFIDGEDTIGLGVIGKEGSGRLRAVSWLVRSLLRPLEGTEGADVYGGGRSCEEGRDVGEDGSGSLGSWYCEGARGGWEVPARKGSARLCGVRCRPMVVGKAEADMPIWQASCLCG